MSKQQDRTNTKSIDKRIFFINAVGCPFVNGFPKKFGFVYTNALEPYLSVTELNDILLRINTVVDTYWPCTCALLIGYLSCIFTLGLSFFIPYICISEVITNLKEELEEINMEMIEKHKSIEFKLIKGWFLYRIEIRHRKDNEDSELINLIDLDR